MSSERVIHRVTVGLGLAILLLAGCARSRGEIFGPVSAELRWPPSPDAARIHWVGEIVTSEDLKPGRSLLAGVGAAIFGKDAARSMLTPYAVTTDGSQRLFVCDSNAQVIHVFDLDRRRYDRWQPPDPGFGQPVGVAYDNDTDRLLVADSVAGTIFVFTGDGKFQGEIGGDHLLRPCGLAVDRARRRIFVADASAHQVVVLGTDGALEGRIGTRGTQLGNFNYPTNVAVDDAGRLYVSDTLNFRVQVFDPEGRPIRQIGEHGDLPGYFSQPKGVAVDGSGHVYVVDARFEGVQVFDAEGNLLMVFGREGRGPGEFWLPAGIHIDENDRIWVADSYNRRVQVFEYRPEGTP